MVGGEDNSIRHVSRLQRTADGSNADSLLNPLIDIVRPASIVVADEVFNDRESLR